MRRLSSQHGEAKRSEDDGGGGAAKDDGLDERNKEGRSRRWAAIDQAAGRGGSIEEWRREEEGPGYLYPGP
jgi:hypothetical protein